MPEVKVSSTYSGTNVRGINVASEEKSLLTIQNCTLDVVCAGETTSAWSVMNALYTANGDISIADANVNAVIGKARNSANPLPIRGGTAIYAVGCTLRITDSYVTAGAYSSRAQEVSGRTFKYTALEGKNINLTRCTLDLTGQGGDAATAARAIHTNQADGSITLTNCKGTLSGSDYGIHIELNDGKKQNNATLAISGGNLTITGEKKAIYTTGKTPEFTNVTVKSGADADSAQEINLDTPGKQNI